VAENVKQRAHDCTAGCRREEVFVFVWCCYFEKKDRKIFEQRKQSRRKVRKVQKKENIYEEKKKRGLRRLVQTWELLNKKRSRVDTSASRNASCWQARAGCEYSLFFSLPNSSMHSKCSGYFRWLHTTSAQVAG